MFFKKTQAKVEHMYARFLSQPPDIHADFSRLARMVTGSAVGLVLGGGGARGCSHVGMIKAILEAGIPIDAVGGVSIGAFIGGLWCKERDITELTVKARSFSYKMVQKWRFIVDITYPHTSYFSGTFTRAMLICRSFKRPNCSFLGVSFNTLLKEVFSDEIDIRDFWLPYFTVTTDITDSSMRIHDYGTAWRYIRASMSLAGYMPPLCDPHDGHLLLDGGYVNNLPADIMRMRGARHIMAVDVGYVLNCT
jgi:lysophospholipid hydrolase